MNKALPLLGTLLALCAFGLGLFFKGYQDLHYAPAALCLIIFGCLGVAPSFWRGLKIPSAPAAMAMFALWIYVTLSLSWSTVPYASLVTYLIFIACPIAFFTPLLAPDPERWLKPLALCLLGLLAICSGWAITQYVFMQDIYGPRAHHPLPNPNNLAGLINLGLLPALALFMTSKERGGQFFGSLLLLMLFLGGLIATESRGGILAALISSGVLVFILRKEQSRIGRHMAIAIGGAALIYAVIAYFGNYDLGSRLLNLAASGGDSGLNARYAIWDSTWQMFKDHLLTGTGFGTFYLYYPSYRLIGADNSTGNWAHMDPLQYGAEMGIIAPLLFYTLCFTVLFRTIAALKTAETNSKERIIIATTFCALMALIIHSHATFNLYIMPSLLVIGVWLAVWYHATTIALSGNGYQEIEIAAWQKPFMAIVTLSIAGLIGTMAVSSAMGQHHLLRAHNLIRQGLTEQFVAAIEDAETWAPRSFIDPEVKLAALYIDLLGPNAAALFTTEEQQMLYGQTLDLLDNASLMNPAWAEIDYKRGQLYAHINPDFDLDTKGKALAALESAVRKDPMHFDARGELARLYISRGHVEKAYNVLEAGLRYPHPKAVEAEYADIISRIKSLVDLKRAHDKSNMTDMTESMDKAAEE